MAKILEQGLSMPLLPEKVIELKLVRSRNGEQLPIDKYKDKSTVDITIRDVLIKGTGRTKDTVCITSAAILKPQESAYLISEEFIHVPKGYVAYVFLKNRLSQRGLLAFNTGIIDSDYHGPISTLVTNLANEDMPIPMRVKNGKINEEERAFFRVTFHKINKHTDGKITFSETFTQEEYKNQDDKEKHDIKYEKYKNWRAEELNTLPKSFLDPERIKNQVNLELTEKMASISLTRLGLLIGVLGLLFGLLPLAQTHITDTYLDKYIKKDSVRLQELEKKVADLEKKLLK